MRDPIRVAVVGAGVGSQHIEAYQTLAPQFEVVAICDLDVARAQQVANAYRIPAAFGDFEHMCQLVEADVIDLCTPSYLHYAQTQQALMEGKHVICEKPATGSLREIDDLIALERHTGKLVMPIFQYRFGHGMQKLKALIAAGLTGQAYLTTVETAWRRRAPYYAAPWRGKWDTELGGAVLTLAIHAHDLLCYVLGPVKSVFARTATKVNPIETEDCLVAALEMADGSLASLAVTTGSAQEISRHRFCFSGLTAESQTEPYRNSSDPWIFTGDSPELNAQIAATLAAFKPQPERFVGQFARFAEAWQQHTALPVTLADARLILELTTAIYYSAHTGQPVNLPLGVDHPFYQSWRCG